MFVVRCSLFVVALLLLSSRALAHPAVSAVAVVKIEPSGRVTITLTHDALAYALNDQPSRIADEPMYALLRGPREDLAAAFADAKGRLTTDMHITVGGAPLAFQLTEWPTVEAAERWQRENPAGRLPVKLDFVAIAQLPANPGNISLQLPATLADVILMLDRPGVEPLTIPLSPGEASPPLPALPSSDTAPFTSSASTPSPAPPSPGALSVAWRFTKLGFEHIIPRGADHALFVLGLFLLVPRFRTVLWQISAFTVAHTITLTLTSLHIIGLSSRIVEPAIAASIAFVAVENLFSRRISPWRIAVAFLFGLVHGMGVATSFNEAGFPPGQLVPALAAFTVGVEAGHITVLIAAFALLGWSNNKPWYRARVAVPLSFAIAAIALYWFITRL
jgi:hypothetical protein